MDPFENNVQIQDHLNSCLGRGQTLSPPIQSDIHCFVKPNNVLHSVDKIQAGGDTRSFEPAGDSKARHAIRPSVGNISTGLQIQVPLVGGGSGTCNKLTCKELLCVGNGVRLDKIEAAINCGAFHAGLKVLSHVLIKRGAQGFDKASETITLVYKGL